MNHLEEFATILRCFVIFGAWSAIGTAFFYQGPLHTAGIKPLRMFFLILISGPLVWIGAVATLLAIGIRYLYERIAGVKIDWKNFD